MLIILESDEGGLFHYLAYTDGGRFVARSTCEEPREDAVTPPEGVVLEPPPPPKS